MNTLLKKIVEKLNNAKTHASHTAIKGKKSGGKRDSNGTDWKDLTGSMPTS